MPSGITIEFKNERLKKAFRDAASRANNMHSVWDDIGERLRKSITQNFEVGGRPTKWQRLKRSTLIARAGGKRKAFTKKGKLSARGKKFIIGAKILKDNGILQGSITYHSRSDGVKVGSNEDYAATHQFGRTFGRGAPIPARPFLVIQNEDESYMANEIEKFLTDPLK